jgi:PAS domain S-box-containing protein
MQPEKVTRRLARYGIAVLLSVVALGLRLLLSPMVGRRGYYVGFLLATAISAGIGGVGPGVVAALGGALLAGFVLPPGGWLHLTNPADPFMLLRYLVLCAVIIAICEALIRSRERAKIAETRLRESERIYRGIGESIPFGIWICDAAGRNTYASESFLELVGLRQEEYSTGGWARVLHPEDAQRTLEAWQDCVRDQGVWDVEVRVLGTDGKYHPLLARGVPIRDDAGRLVCWAGISLDVSRIKEAEDELRRSNRELEQFAFVASHDLQEPLRMVNVYTQLLLRNLPENRSSELDLYASFIREGVERMSRMTEDLLAFSRVIHSGVEKRPVDPSRAVEKAVGACRTLVEESGAEVFWDPLPAVLAEEAHLSQVFQNLISNAIKYRKPDTPPRIRIASEKRSAEAVFLVQDNGIGFDQVYAETIFGLFKRLHGRELPGNGLGLTICHRLVERYGGRIWAESKVGEGSTFYFTLPLSAGQQSGDEIGTGVANSAV